jgi:hypothetical protein
LLSQTGVSEAACQQQKWTPTAFDAAGIHIHPAGIAWIYFSETSLEADPPYPLRTVMLVGFVGHDNEAEKLPPPLFDNVPMSTPVPVTYTRSTAVGSVPLASTRKSRGDREYCAR